MDHGQLSKPVAKLCRVGTTAAHTTFAGSWHRVVHEVGVLRGCRGVRRAGAGQQASGGSPLAICRRSLAQIGRKTRYRGFGTKEISSLGGLEISIDFVMISIDSEIQ